MNTIPPNDFSYYEMLNEVVQQEPAGSLDPELMGSIAAIGIVKGQPFAPDARMKKILTEAVAVGNATARSLFMRPRDPSWYYYPGSAWMPLTLTISGYDFETPPPVIEGPVEDGVRTPEGVEAFPPTGYRMLDARTNFHYGVIMVSPAEGMLLSGIGSQYLMATVDADKAYFDGAKTYKVTLPEGIPAKNFWSLTVYDTQTRSMLDTPQRYPRAGSQSYPSPAAEPNADGSTTVYFAPSSPTGWRAATGSRPSRVRAGSCCCASTARSNRSSTRPGDRARSSWSHERTSTLSGISAHGPGAALCQAGGTVRVPGGGCGRQN